MTNLSEQEVEREARGLSDQLRAAFERSADKKMHADWKGRISTYGDPVVGEELYRLGLIEKPGTYSNATPRGLADRSYLERNPQ